MLRPITVAPESVSSLMARVKDRALDVESSVKASLGGIEQHLLRLKQLQGRLEQQLNQ